MEKSEFASQLLAWFALHGRHDLPWQQQRTPYRVWISEIMLQQTQVNTVIPYFQRFMQQFPEVVALANAPQDEVLHLWTGLGYYARARNLHRAAQQIRDEHQGKMPTSLDGLVALPGIGRSTAAAILAQAHGERHAILDGNVKRVLARLHAVEGWPGQKAVENRLWDLAEQHTPSKQLTDYTQAIMDLGATICRRRPECGLCPVAQLCDAHQQGSPTDYPSPKPRKTLPVRQATMLVVRNPNDEILLLRRPPAGIWGGLWCLPECPEGETVPEWSRQQLGLELDEIEMQPGFRHTFSHYHLDITPILARAKAPAKLVMEASGSVWYNTRQPPELGLPAPVVNIMNKLDGRN